MAATSTTILLREDAIQERELASNPIEGYIAIPYKEIHKMTVPTMAASFSDCAVSEGGFERTTWYHFHQIREWIVNGLINKSIIERGLKWT